MKVMAVGAWLVLAATGCAPRPPAPPPDQSQAALTELAGIEKAFSARSEAVGAAQAWSEYVDPDEGMLFGATGEPAVGRAAIFAAMGGDADPPGVITWASDKAWAAKSGELAVSWGHWTFKPKAAGKPEARGRYVTVWRRDAAGAWKALVDIGNTDAPPGKPE